MLRTDKVAHSALRVYHITTKGEKDMKKVCILLAALFLIVTLGLSADETLISNSFSSSGNWASAYGDWQVQRGRAYQMDHEAGMAKVNFRVPQSGVMQYEFNARYVDGGRDGHAGFGIHIFVDKAHPGKSWGNGESYLLWLNYDKNTDKSEHYGYRAQVYKSESDTEMELMEGYSLRIPTSYLKPEYIDATVPVKIQVYSDTGEVRVYHPIRDNYYYYFYLDFDGMKRGSYISLRTNGLAASFDQVKVTKIQ
jgi:hypothetical protein